MIKDDLKITVLSSKDGKMLTIHELPFYGVIFGLAKIAVGGYLGYKIISIIRRRKIC